MHDRYQPALDSHQSIDYAKHLLEQSAPYMDEGDVRQSESFLKRIEPT